MRITLCLLLALSFFTSAGARDFDWVIVDTLDYALNPTFLRSSVAVNSSGEPVRARLVDFETTATLDTYGDFRIEQYDRFGSLLGSRELRGQVQVEQIIFDRNDELLVRGLYRDTIDAGSGHVLVDTGSGSGHFLLKLDEARDAEWLIDPGSNEPGFWSVDAMTVDHANRIWIGATCLTHSTIHRLDPDGNVAATYTQAGVRGVSGLAVDPDGSIWAAGPAQGGAHSFNGMAAVGPFTYSNYIVRYAPDGTGLWVQYVEDITFQSPELVSDGSGHAYIAGQLNGLFSFGGLVPEGIDWIYDFFLTRIDSTGQFLWLREVPADMLSGDAQGGRGSHIACPDDSTVYFCGFSRGSVEWGAAGVPPSFGSRDVLVLGYSSDGETRWAKTAGSSGLDIADAVAVDRWGNCFIAGQVGDGSQFDDQSFGGTFSNAYIASLPAAAPTSMAGGAPVPASRLLEIAPNPFNPLTTIRYSLDEPSAVSLKIYDPAGALVRVLARGWRNRGVHAVDWDGLDDDGRPAGSGAYFCRFGHSDQFESIRMILIR